MKAKTKLRAYTQKNFWVCYNHRSFLHFLAWAYQHNFTSFTIRISRVVLPIVSLLYRHKLVRSYTVQNITWSTKKTHCVFRGITVTVFLQYYHDRPAVTNIIMFSRPGQMVPISLKKLERLIRLDKGPLLHLISTSSGYFTAKQAVKKHVSGFLVARIS
jgi:ribosomal protein S8